MLITIMVWVICAILPVEVKGGIIVSVDEEGAQLSDYSRGHILDYGEAVVMPGLVDM